ncbi:MAG: ADP-ribosylglycohydrolase family protein [Thermoproteota archaeon]|nr:ADP-ribosylglycohydrolase family protein [Candidatus Brockarchaeota archaeon]MBO3768646.1 ADP-ribosylglycohydrolase family protein [Candidatus Brockarchaeota archaeon]MBO3801973.1 ADP-ribosylglycohydrolase family protein [Candidatus Brockarchaeota archaeon]
MHNVIQIDKRTYYDKVCGCLLGKNAGGTLGGPLERIYGEEKMFDVWWYPKLVEGGIPNDDLEIQLVWLQALKERGIFITARDLAEYWLDHVLYNPDEYGLHKTNLRLGLQPPVSGWYNNWFKDCMGSPIRSEIWACIAPGSPNVAAMYAYQDAICDHAGGEGVFGEVFNAVIESSAFLINDVRKLINLGLSVIPENSLTSKAIRTAIQCYESGLDWKEARQRVKEVAYSPIAQFSPINLGFQTIGLLYGKNFGDAICKAVNCGWDTDCTGATVGALLGIIHGANSLPQEWIKPLSNKIAISNGIKNLQVPTTVEDLANEIQKIAEKVLVTFNGGQIQLSDFNNFSSAEEVIENELKEIQKLKLWEISPNEINFDLITLKASLSYLESPVILPDVKNSFAVTLENTRSEILSGSIKVIVPGGWIIEPSSVRQFVIKPGEKIEFRFSLLSSIASINRYNKCIIDIDLNERPSITSIPLVFVSGFRWLVSNVFREKDTLTTFFQPENDSKLLTPGRDWIPVSWSTNELEVEQYFNNLPGIIYLRHFIYSPSRKKVVLGVPNNSKMKLWLNGKIVHETQKVVPLRPNYGGDGSNYTSATLEVGWNHIMVKLVREEKPLKAHFVVSDAEWNNGLTDLIRHKLPWE